MDFTGAFNKEIENTVGHKLYESSSNQDWAANAVNMKSLNIWVWSREARGRLPAAPLGGVQAEGRSRCASAHVANTNKASE